MDSLNKALEVIKAQRLGYNWKEFDTDDVISQEWAQLEARIREILK